MSGTSEYESGTIPITLLYPILEQHFFHVTSEQDSEKLPLYFGATLAVPSYMLS
jgi:hypothetical protein